MVIALVFLFLSIAVISIHGMWAVTGSYTEAHENALLTAGELAIIMTAWLSIAGIILAHFTRSILPRLKRIETGIDTLCQGAFKEINVAGDDEISRLADGFNKLGRRIHEDRLAKEQYMSVLDLEAKAREGRAGELEALNADLEKTSAELLSKNRRLEEMLVEMKEVNQRLADTKERMIQSEKMASLGQLAAGVATKSTTPSASSTAI
jgi:phosphoglycerate-specific signal transduction histidine kinase